MSEKKATTHKPATTGFWAVFDKILDFFAILSCIALLVISFIVVADVIMRYAFSKPFGFTTPLAEMVLVCVLLAVGVLGYWVMDGLDRFFHSPQWHPDEWEPPEDDNEP